MQWWIHDFPERGRQPQRWGRKPIILANFYRPQTKLREGNVFTGLSTGLNPPPRTTHPPPPPMIVTPPSGPYLFHQMFLVQIISPTRMHSSRMGTGRSLTVCWRLLPGGGGGVPGWGGVCSWGGAWSGVVCLVQGGCLVRGVCAWSVGRGWCLLLGGVCLVGGGCLVGGWCVWSGGVGVSQHALRQTPLPPVDRQTHSCKNITLAQLRCGR